MTAFWDTEPCSLVEVRTDDSEVLIGATIRAIFPRGGRCLAIHTSETSVCFYETARRSIPEYCHLHTRRRENLKYHQHFFGTKSFIAIFIRTSR
jgi:hypothetical protein